MAPLRVLALCGFTQNAFIYSKQLGAVRKACKSAEFVFLDPPHVVEKADMPWNQNLDDFDSTATTDAAAQTAETTPRAWWLTNADRTVYRKFDETLAYIHDFMARNGPFDGVMGFSQGACMAAILCALLEKPGALSAFPSEPAFAPFKFAIIVGGFLPTPAVPNLDHLWPLPARLPTLHVVGRNDTLITEERSRTLIDKCENVRRELHDGGHFTPSKASWRHFFNAYIASFAEGGSQGKDIPSPSAPSQANSAISTAAPTPVPSPPPKTHAEPAVQATPSATANVPPAQSPAVQAADPEEPVRGLSLVDKPEPARSSSTKPPPPVASINATPTRTTAKPFLTPHLAFTYLDSRQALPCAGSHLLVSDTLTSPGHFAVYHLILSALHAGTKTVWVDFRGEGRPSLESVARKLGLSVPALLVYLSPTDIFALDAPEPSLQPTYDAIDGALESNAVVVLDGLREVQWAGAADDEIGRFIRAVLGRVRERDAVLVSAIHADADPAAPGPDPLLARLVRTADAWWRISGLATGRSADVHGELAAHLDVSHAISAAEPLQYRLEAGGISVFAKGTGRGYL
ncbi:Family of serine hydrolases 3 [Cryptotrichosporon argae]